MEDQWERIPDTAWAPIVLCLPAAEAVQCLSVCRGWLRAAESSRFWRLLLKRDLHLALPNLPDGDCRDVYVGRIRMNKRRLLGLRHSVASFTRYAHAPSAAFWGNIGTLEEIIQKIKTVPSAYACLNMPQLYVSWVYYGNYSHPQNSSMHLNEFGQYMPSSFSTHSRLLEVFHPLSRRAPLLHWAVMGNQFDFIYHLLTRYPHILDLDYIVPEYQVTARQVAHTNQYIQIAQLLDEASAARQEWKRQFPARIAWLESYSSHLSSGERDPEKDKEVVEVLTQLKLQYVKGVVDKNARTVVRSLASNNITPPSVQKAVSQVWQWMEAIAQGEARMAPAVRLILQEARAHWVKLSRWRRKMPIPEKSSCRHDRWLVVSGLKYQVMCVTCGAVSFERPVDDDSDYFPPVEETNQLIHEGEVDNNSLLDEEEVKTAMKTLKEWLADLEDKKTLSDKFNILARCRGPIVRPQQYYDVTDQQHAMAIAIFSQAIDEVNSSYSGTLHPKNSLHINCERQPKSNFFQISAKVVEQAPSSSSMPSQQHHLDELSRLLRLAAKQGFQGPIRQVVEEKLARMLRNYTSISQGMEGRMRFD